MSVVIDGSNGVDIGAGNLTFPDNTTQTTAPTSIGVGQTWQNVTASRASNTVYTNSTGKPIQVAIIGNQSNTGISLTIGGVLVANATMVSGYSQPAWVGGIVPNGATYKINAVAFSNWAELR